MCLIKFEKKKKTWYKAKEQKHKPKVEHHQTWMKRLVCYVNCITSFYWNQIQLADRKTMSKEGLSPLGIVQWLHHFDNPTFCRLSKSTVANWIEKKNDVCVWKESTLFWAKCGNILRHDKGGCCDIIVKWPKV